MAVRDELSHLMGEVSGKLDTLVGFISSLREEQSSLGNRLGLAEQRITALETAAKSNIHYLSLGLALAAIGATIGGYFF